MHSPNVVVVLGFLLVPFTLARLDARVANDPVSLYLTRMCYPRLSNLAQYLAPGHSGTIDEQVAILATSPFPCEQGLYLSTVCMANGTTAVDFLAEQQCLCGSDYFELQMDCSACFISHGSQVSETPEQLASEIASLKSAECSAGAPSQAFTNLLEPVNITSVSLAPSLTLGTDRFPNNTAVSNYATITRSATPGAITGSATGRLTRFTNYEGNRFTPSSTLSSAPTTVKTNGSSSASVADVVSSSSSKSTSAPASSTSKAAAMRGDHNPAGGILAVALGAIALL